MKKQSQPKEFDNVEDELVFEEVGRRTSSYPFDQSPPLDSQQARDDIEAANDSEPERIIEY
jgi:hypothetical protein